jgi:hypothetical protein
MKISSITAITCTLAALFIGISPTVNAAPTTPSRVGNWQLGQVPYQTSGVVWNQSFRGSGTVAYDPNIAVGCAHVSFNNGTFLTGHQWHAAYHGESSPSFSPGRQTLRGYYAWTGYRGGTSSDQFDLDFVVHYAYAPLAGGAKAGLIYYNDPRSHALASTSTQKLIVGYPGSDKFYMNSVGTFSSAYTQVNGNYLWNPSVKGGPGMSGGGVFSFFQNHWCLAGVHVSGDRYGGMGAGVRAIDSSAFALVNNAIKAARANQVTPTTRTFQSTFPMRVPDNSANWTVLDIAAFGLPASLVEARISLVVAHTRQADLQAVLASPSGRTVTLHNQTGGSGRLVISQRSVGASFAGTNPNGNWRLMVRDRVARNTGSIGNVSLEVTAR